MSDGYDVCYAGVGVVAGSQQYALVLRGEGRAESVRDRQRVYRCHHGPGEVPRPHQTIPLPKGMYRFS